MENGDYLFRYRGTAPISVEFQAANSLKRDIYFGEPKYLGNGEYEIGGSIYMDQNFVVPHHNNDSAELGGNYYSSSTNETINSSETVQNFNGPIFFNPGLSSRGYGSCADGGTTYVDLHPWRTVTIYFIAAYILIIIANLIMQSITDSITGYQNRIPIRTEYISNQNDFNSANRTPNRIYHPETEDGQFNFEVAKLNEKISRPEEESEQK